MLSKRPIRVKLLIGLGLLVLLVAILSGSGLYATFAYRGLVKSLRQRVNELPLAGKLGRHVGDLRITVSELHGLRAATFSTGYPDRVPLYVRMLRDQFRAQFAVVEETLADYRGQLENEGPSESQMADNQHEWETVHKIEAGLLRVREVSRDEDWILSDVKTWRLGRLGELDNELADLQALTAELPSYLHAKLAGFADEVRGQYHTMIAATGITSASAGLVFALLVRLFYLWIFLPLRILIDGSRQVAAGKFNSRIHLHTSDEMSELAEAMNDMTARFQAIRDDLDRQVQERTKQVVRSEQLASVGFLAAGVAHEINNPLASIAMCAESLEGRIREILEHAPQDDAEGEQLAVIRNYLRMIQDEAFRCKEITGKLLDFSRLGPVRRQRTELGELVQGVIDMVGHLGKYQRKHIVFRPGAPVVAPLNAQEIKQVVLNLLINALDSLEDDGTVQIDLVQRGSMAELTLVDNGCGMEPQVLRHVFEPFFTRRRAGQQGTGLGLSISYRIVADHGGEIEAQSGGAGQGSTFRVRLPLVETQKEIENRYQAA